MQDDLQKAWHIYSLADHILHSRIESMLIAQAFLVGAYAAVAAGGTVPKYAPALQGLIIFFAIAITIIFFVSNKRLQSKMRKIDEITLSSDPQWKVFQNGSRIPDWNWISIEVAVPSLCLVFWLLVTLIASPFPETLWGSRA